MKEGLEITSAKIDELKLEIVDVIPVLWRCVMDSVQRSNKSSTQQQTHQSVLKLLRTWIKLFQTHCQSSRGRSSC